MVPINLCTELRIGAYTNQLVTIDPTRGNALNFLFGSDTSSANDTLSDWYFNTTITAGNSTLTDGAKRDRLVWSGDMAIALPGIAVSTYDLISIRNALDSLFNLQNTDGQLPYAGYPFNELGVVSFTYHLYGLIGVANVYQWSGDKSYLTEKWSAWQSGMEWAAQQIDSTGLANITESADWLRYGMGGHNVEANSILFYTLTVGATLATLQNDTTTAARWTQLAQRIQAAAIPLLWQPTVGLFRDNETTTLAPQDGNAWAVKSGLVASPSQISQISQGLEARWGAYGAPAPEAADAVSPFISGFELEAHFAANRTRAALALVRNMWADFMLDDPRMTNSTFIEGYSTSGALHYAPYSDDARISHAHGWATGPTSSLMVSASAQRPVVRDEQRSASLTPGLFVLPADLRGRYPALERRRGDVDNRPTTRRPLPRRRGLLDYQRRILLQMVHEREHSPFGGQHPRWHVRHRRRASPGQPHEGEPEVGHVPGGDGDGS